MAQVYNPYAPLYNRRAGGMGMSMPRYGRSPGMRSFANMGGARAQVGGAGQGVGEVDPTIWRGGFQLPNPGRLPNYDPIFNPQSAPQPPDQSGSTGSNAGKPGNYLNDPILDRIRAYTAARRTSAASNRLAASEQELLGYGSSELADQVLNAILNEGSIQSGLGSDLVGADRAKLPSLLEQIKKNADPYTGMSTLAQLGYQNIRRTSQSEDALNTPGRNLWFSGAHAEALGELGRQRQFAEAQARDSVMRALAGYSSGYQSELDQANQMDIEGEQAAYERSLAYALNNGGTGAPGPGGWLQRANQLRRPRSQPYDMNQIKRQFGYGDTQPWTAGL